VLVWYKDQIPSDELKWDLVDLTIKKATFKDPVYVEMVTARSTSWTSRPARPRATASC